MQRRKYLAAMGSLAAGGAAMMGTGAFTTGETPRSATVRVSNDDTDAKLGFSTKVGYGGQSGGAGRSEYANVNGGVLEIDFSGSDSGSESGMNPNGAIYTFDKVFKVINQGQKKVLVGLDIGSLRSLDAIDEAQVHVNPDGPDLDETLDFSTDPVSVNNQQSGATLDPGEELLVDFRFVTANDPNTPFEETPNVSIGGADVNSQST